MKYGTFKLTFPSTFHGDGTGYIQHGSPKDAVIKALRVLSPGMGLRETRDLIFTTGPQLVKFGYTGMRPSAYYDAIDTLTENGVVIESCDETEPESRVKAAPSTEFIAADIRLIVVGALKRKEYDTVAELIKVLKDLDNI